MDGRPGIIIIEDHPVMREGLVSYFAGTGRWRVMGKASCITEAKEQLTHNGNEADVVLLDIQLKDGSGLDIIPWFAEHKSMKRRPIIAVYSTFDDRAHVNAALSIGVHAYICKHSNEKELEAALQKALRGETYIDKTAQTNVQNAANLLELLTKRETEILALVKLKLSNRQIAARLGISIRTTENILSCVYSKIGVHSRLELELL